MGDNIVTGLGCLVLTVWALFWTSVIGLVIWAFFHFALGVI